MLRLKSLFVGGLSLLMLGLFPAFACASKEVRSVEMSVAAVKQYYRDRDYVSLFDALVFAGGKYSRLMRPSEIHLTRQVDKFKFLKHLEPILSKIDKVHLQGELQGIPFNNVLPLKGSQEVLSSGGVVVHIAGISENRFDAEFLDVLRETIEVFPKTDEYTDLLTMSLADVKGIRKTALKLADVGHYSEHGWFSCIQIDVGHTKKGMPHPQEGAPRQSVVTVWLFDGDFPHTNVRKTCELRGFLFAAGLRGNVLSVRDGLHLDADKKPGIGPELQCAFDLLYLPQIVDGMSRNDALTIVNSLPEMETYCD